MSIRRFRIDPKGLWLTMMLAQRPDRELTAEGDVPLAGAKFISATYLPERGLLEIVAESSEWNTDTEFADFTFHVKEKDADA